MRSSYLSLPLPFITRRGSLDAPRSPHQVTSCPVDPMTEHVTSHRVQNCTLHCKRRAPFAAYPEAWQLNERGEWVPDPDCPSFNDWNGHTPFHLDQSPDDKLVPAHQTSLTMLYLSNYASKKELKSTDRFFSAREHQKAQNEEAHHIETSTQPLMNMQ